ncbi:MAG TPA: fibronectin type III domain-containing protein [Bacteroidaceae bacterium]|nr:fibronectin type III domain-containing protein [Bacteroidaceae bacterium]
MKKIFPFVLSVMFFIGLNLSCTPSEQESETELVSTGAASNVSSFSVTLSGTIGGLSSTQISQGKFGFLYIQEEALNGVSAIDIFLDCLDNNFIGECAVQHVVGIQPGGNFSFDLKKLSSGCTYYYCAFVVKSDNSAHIGNVSSFSTISFPPDISTGSSTEVNFYSAKLSGGVSISKTDLTSVNIGIVYSTSDTPASGSGTLVRFALDLDANSNFKILVSGLKPGTMYYYRTYAYSKDDRRYFYSEPDSFCTKDLSEMAVDLGLSVKWALCNLGGENPMDCGDFYRWGEIKPDGSGSEIGYTHYDPSTGLCSNLGEDISGTEYDAAYVKLGGRWRMPTKAEFDELIRRCHFEDHTTENARKITGPSGKHVLFPHSGAITDGDSFGAFSFFWCSSADQSSGGNAAYCFINARVTVIDINGNQTEEPKGLMIAYIPYFSFPIRPVCDY